MFPTQTSKFCFSQNFSQLTVGIPLLIVIFGLNNDTPQLGLYMLPLLVWYTIQLLVGYFFVSPLQKFVSRSYHQQEQQDGMMLIKGSGSGSSGGAGICGVSNDSESTFEDEEVGGVSRPGPASTVEAHHSSQDDQEVRIPYVNDEGAVDEDYDDDDDDSSDDEEDNSLMFDYIHQRHSNDGHDGCYGGDEQLDDGHLDDGIAEFVDDEINSWLSEMAYSDIVFDETSRNNNNNNNNTIAGVSIGSDDSTYFDDDDEEEEEEEEGELFHDENVDDEGQLPVPQQEHIISAANRRQVRPTYGPRPDLSEEWKPTQTEI